MDAFDQETIAMLQNAFQRLKDTPLASLNLLSQLQDVIELAEIELDNSDD